MKSLKDSLYKPQTKSYFEEKLNTLEGDPCDLCQATHKNGRFHYLDKDGYSYMFICPDRFTCQKINRFHSRRIEYVKKESRMPADLLCKSISNFIITEWWQQNALTTLSMWTYSDKKWVCLTGGPGTGKTHLVSAVVNELLNTGVEVLYTYFAEFMEAVRFKDLTYMEKARNVPVLFMDDLYKGNISYQEIKETAALINYRYTHDYVTFITTEKSPEELFEVDEATIGRILDKCDGCWADFPHEKESDYRIKDILGMYK